MIIIQTKDLAKAYGVEVVLEKISFQISKGEKAGLVGINGAGKTTLFKCLTGEILPDTGTVSFGEKVSVGYLQQIPEYPNGTGLFSVVVESCTQVLALRDRLQELEKRMSEVSDKQLDKVMEQYSQLTESYEAVGGYGLETKVRRIIKGLGFNDEDLNRDVNLFSGGEKTRVSLAKLLVNEPDLLLLDEPTNHLDVVSTEWLEDFLKGYPGAVLVISHDRYFLDKVVTRVLEIESHKLIAYNGNYSRYMQLKEEMILAQSRAYEKQQAEISKTLAYIERYRAGIKAKQARGRQSKLGRVQLLNNVESTKSMVLKTNEVASSGEMVLQVEDLTKCFGDKPIFQKINLLLRRGDKVGLIGSNGTGKSTLLKVILGQISAEGQVNLGSRVKIAYYDQEQQNLDYRNRLIDEIMFNFDINEGVARKHLATVLFQGDDVYKSVTDLSGGERARLAFLKLALSGANFLVLDEPTNHLDIPSKQIIEAFLNEYEGTVLFVSHDRYFIDELADKVIELEQGIATEYWGNYSYYKEKKAAFEKELAEAKALAKAAVTKRATDTKKPTQPKPDKQLAKLEEEIEVLEAKKEELALLLAEPALYQDEAKAKELVKEFRALEERISGAYQMWEELMENA